VRQPTLAAQTGFEKYGRKSKREQFLEGMGQVIPWNGVRRVDRTTLSQGREWAAAGGVVDHAASVLFAAVVQPVGSEGGRGAVGIARAAALCRGGLGRCSGSGREHDFAVPHWLEKHDLGEAMLPTVNEYLESQGIRISRGTIVDATIIHAPSSTKNRSGERDPGEMHQTRKGKQWYFGLKAHMGVDSKQGHVHSVCTSAASVADKHMLLDLLHGEERKVWGDGGYQGQGEAIRQAAPQAQDMTSRRVQYKNFGTLWTSYRRRRIQ
jgi:transposase, IS5 family